MEKISLEQLPNSCTYSILNNDTAMKDDDYAVKRGHAQRGPTAFSTTSSYRVICPMEPLSRTINVFCLIESYHTILDHF